MIKNRELNYLLKINPVNNIKILYLFSGKRNNLIPTAVGTGSVSIVRSLNTYKILFIHFLSLSNQYQNGRWTANNQKISNFFNPAMPDFSQHFKKLCFELSL